MARDIYNFIWVTHVPTTQMCAPAPQQIKVTVGTQRAVTPGVILFPAFLTPLVHIEGHDEPWLELLIATKHELTAAMVNRQLKISYRLRAKKPYDPGPLFPDVGDRIVVAAVGEVGEGTDVREAILDTHSKFAGILHPCYAEALRTSGATLIFRVKVDAAAIPTFTSPEELNYSTQFKHAFVGYAHDGCEAQAYGGVVTQGNELSDELIRTMLLRRFGNADSSAPNPIPGRGRYAFPMQGDTVELGSVDGNSPIQSYHPLIVMTGDDAREHLDFGHVSDIHINTRWQTLARSDTRVIEYADDAPEQGESPKIGELLAETNRSFHDVLSSLCTEADLMIVGGDLIDHIRNAYSPRLAASSGATVGQIWAALDLEDGAYTETSYPVGLDLIAFYSIIFDAMSRHSMPFFGITGNHDCYVDAYGISPRVGFAHEISSSRTNEGIPADLNLTFYEALLAFGPSGGMLTQLGSCFNKEWFDWFHFVLSPFNDWRFKLPRQSLVGLGWGDSEDIFADEQGAGHLPRSEDGISDGQLALLEQAIAGRADHRVTLVCHFTFFSFANVFPMIERGTNRHTTGMFSSGWHLYTEHELGTFETNRGALIEILTGKQLQCVLTGHSHRRGLYLLDEANWQGITATIFDPNPENPNGLSQLSEVEKGHEPFVIVSDSGGPYPRYNRSGEFNGWGSDRPGGTLIRFGDDGRVDQVLGISATTRSKPRAAVAMDYVDVLSGAVFVDNQLKIDALTGDQISGKTEAVYVIDPNFTTQVRTTWQIDIERLIFAGFYKGAWLRIETQWDPQRGCFVVPSEAASEFRTWLRGIQTPSRYVSLKMGTSDTFLAQHYDWDSHWNFEVEVGSMEPGKEAGRLYHYRIRRPRRSIKIRGQDVNWRESPNFDWRQAHLPKYGE